MDLRTLDPEVAKGLELQRLALVREAELVGPRGAFARIALHIAEPMQAALVAENMRGTHPYTVVEAMGVAIGFIAGSTAIQYAQQAEDPDAFQAMAVSGMMNFAIEQAGRMFGADAAGTIQGLRVQLPEDGTVTVTNIGGGEG